MSPLGARAASEPAPSVAAGPLRGTCALGYALAVADLEGRRAHALGGVVLREGLESVRALKRALLFAVTDGLGVVRELAFVLCGRFVYLLRDDDNDGSDKKGGSLESFDFLRHTRSFRMALMSTNPPSSASTSAPTSASMLRGRADIQRQTSVVKESGPSHVNIF